MRVALLKHSSAGSTAPTIGDPSILSLRNIKAHGGKKSFDKVKHKVDHEVIANTGADVCLTSPEEAKLMSFISVKFSVLIAT